MHSLGRGFEHERHRHYFRRSPRIPYQVELERVATRCERLQSVVTAYTAMVAVTVLLPTLLTGSISIPVWPRPQSVPALAATLVAQVSSAAAWRAWRRPQPPCWTPH